MPSDDQAQPRSTDEIRDWLLARIAAHLRVPVEKISPDEPLVRYSLDSVATIDLLADLEQWLGRRIDPEIIFECSTVREFAERLGA